MKDYLKKSISSNKNMINRLEIFRINKKRKNRNK